MGILDNLIIFLYFAAVLVIGLNVKNLKDRTETDYFLAGRNMGWFAIGISLFVTNISSEHFIGLAGEGASIGLAAGAFEWFAIFLLFFLGWIFAPMFLKAGIVTVPEFIGKRYNENSRKYLAIVSIAAYFLTKISVALFAGGLLLNGIFGVDMFTSAVILVLITGLYTVIGGLSSVMHTQIFQVVLLLLAGVILTVFGLSEIGGISEFISKVPAGHFSLFKSISDNALPWTGILFGAPILGIWYWCMDQYIVQRVLSASGVEEAQKGIQFAALLKILPVFLMLVPGMIALVLYPNIEGNNVFLALVTGSLLPTGFKGLVIVGVFSALMSSLASAFNSIATIFTFDFYKPRRPDISSSEMVLIGRLTTTVVVISVILGIPLIKIINTNVYIYLQSIQAYISPPIVSVILIGIFWKRVTGKAAFVALLTGGLIGLFRIIVDVVGVQHFLGIPLINSFATVNYLHFAVFLFIFTSGVLVVLSFLIADDSDVIEKEKYMFHVEDSVMPLGILRNVSAFIRKHQFFLFVVLIVILIGFRVI